MPSGHASVCCWRVLAGGLILATLLARLAYLAFWCPLDLAPDEAHYWDWSRHLDWSYYSKGPLVAWLIRLSCTVLGPLSNALQGSEMFAVRAPAAVCGAFLLLSLYVLTVQVFRSDKLASGVVILFLTLPLFAAGATLMTIDAPFVCCWGWALVAAHRALFRDSLAAFVMLGLLVGLGMLAKYTMVLFLPAVGLFCLATPGCRHHLLRPGIWTAAGIAVLCCLPIILWNVQHGWVTLLHTRGHAGLDETQLQWRGPVNYVVLQFAVLLGFWFIAWVRAVFDYRPGRASADVAFLWWLSVPVFGFFLLFSFKNGGGEANWPVAGYLSGLVLAAAWLARQLESPCAWYGRLTKASVALTALAGLALIAVLHDSRFVQPVLAELAGPVTTAQPFPLRRLDPTCRLKGWRTLAGEIDRLREKLGDDVILAGAGWNLPGEIGFYCQGHPTVYSIGPALGDRHSQYDLWRPNPLADWRQFTGKTFLIVAGGPPQFDGAFDYVRPPITVDYHENGQPIARWTLIVAHGFKGFPSSRSDEY